MPNWVNCTTTDGIAMRVNLDQVALIRAYRSERGFAGSEIVFAAGTPLPIVVNEGRDALTGAAVSRQNT